MKVVRVGMFTFAAALAMMALSSAWGETTGGGTPPPPPQLVAKLLDPLARPSGEAGYGAKFDAKGKITASFLNVTVGPLPKELVGKSIVISVDNVPIGPPVKVGAGNATTPPGAQVKLNSANKDKVPPVKPGSMITVSIDKNPPIAQGKFEKPPKK